MSLKFTIFAVGKSGIQIRRYGEQFVPMSIIFFKKNEKEFGYII